MGHIAIFLENNASLLRRPTGDAADSEPDDKNTSMNTGMHRSVAGIAAKNRRQ